MEQIDDVLIFFIDIVASSYNWSKHDILELCLDEIMEYIKLIRKRELSEKITLLAMLHNPHTKNPKELAKKLEAELRKIDNRDIIEEKADPQAIQKLKQIFNKKR